MHFSTLLLGGGLVPLTLAGYTIQDDYSGDNFFPNFRFDTMDDPTHGYVNYVDQANAQSQGLISTSNGVVTIKSDSTKTGAGRGRDSVRITSHTQYTHGLVILDLEHMPGSACGIWPAFWMTGPNWPNNGEIDILEGVSYQAQNAVTMHTSAGCSMVGKDCQGNQGCSVQADVANSYGDGFNNGKGGVYAMEWTSDAINVWFFRRNSDLSNVLSESPDPVQWGSALASFQGGSGCTIDDHFKNNNIVFDTTFCGDWAGNVWFQDSTCSSKAATCTDYVRDNPSAFTEAYWTIKSLKVFTNNGNTSPARAQPAPAVSTPAEAHVTQHASTPVANTPVPIAIHTKAAETGPLGLGSSTPDGPLSLNPVSKRAAHRGLPSIDKVDTAPSSITERGLQEKTSRIKRHLKHHQMAAIGHS
ncbi:MAG: hypothetical protein Q9217_006432 [Psora testacea]